MSSAVGPHWTAYVAIGTGVAGFLLALWNNHRVNQIERVDHWREAIDELRQATSLIQGLPDQIRIALRSRRALMSMAGRSGAMQKFESECEEDLALADHLRPQVEEIDPQRFDGLNIETLARRRNEINALFDQAKEIRRKYEKSVQDDERQRDRIRPAEPPRSTRR